MTSSPPTLSVAHARRLVRRWEETQSYQNPGREERYEVMLDLLGSALPGPFRALELGPGPGSLCSRLLARFPRATCVAVDHAHLLPFLGQRALPAKLARRLTWVDAELTDRAWTSSLPFSRYDAVVSSTTLHWLPRQPLASVLRACHRLLRPGGLLLDGDWVPLWREMPGISSLVSTAVAREMERYQGPGRSLSWATFWRAVEREPALRGMYAEVRRRTRRRPRGGFDYSERERLQLLKHAGFSQAVVVWRKYNTALLLARR